MMSRFERVKLLTLLSGLWAICPTLALGQSCTDYKFSEEGWDIVRQVVREKVTDDRVLEEAAKVVAPTWFETISNTKDAFTNTIKSSPPFLVFGRSDQIGVGTRGEKNKKLFYDADSCMYPRAYFHAGMGAWQLDTSGMAKSLAAYEAVMPETAVPEVVKKTIKPDNPFGPWFACSQNLCEAAKSEIVKQGGICGDPNITKTGGVVKWRCSWHGQDIDCYWLNPDIAEGRYGWAYSNPDGSCERCEKTRPCKQTPLTAGFLNFKDTTYEYRVWPRLGTGYEQDIWARRPLEQDARDHLEWSTGIPKELLIRGLWVGPSSGATPEKLDVVFLIDTTGSMWDDIAAAAHSAEQIVTKLFEKEGLDVRVALAEYKDFPVAPYGERGDFPYRAIQGFTNQKNDLLTAIQQLPRRVGGGGDIPESVYFAVLSAVDARCLGTWRADARRVLIVIGDAPPRRFRPHGPDGIQFSAQWLGGWHPGI